MTGIPHLPGTGSDSGPWYRQFWPWFLIAVPGSAVVMGIVTAVLAVRSADGLVVDDYYKQGLAINRTLARDEAARQLRMSAVVRFGFASGRIDIQLARAGSPADEQSLDLQILHPTLADQDYSVRLESAAPGSFSGEIPDLIAGQWYIMIESPDREWRLYDRVSLPDQKSVLMQAAQ